MLLSIWKRQGNPKAKPNSDDVDNTDFLILN